MHNACKLSVLCVMLLFAHVALQAQDKTETFANPVFAHDWPDPTVWQGDDSLYYSFSTAGTTYAKGRGKFLWSADMVTWDTIPDYVWADETLAQLKQYGNSFWAPQVTRVGGRWLMYLTCYGKSAAETSIVVLTLGSETFPTEQGQHGPWALHGLITGSRDNQIIDTIDPFVTEDPATGQVWLFFGSTGRNYRVELAADGLSLADDAAFTHVAGLSVAEDARRNKVFEGAYLYHHDGYWYYFASSGLYSNHTYNLQVGRSPSLDGVFVSKAGEAMTEGFATMLLSTTAADKDFYGPGHGGEIFTDHAGRSYMYYHCHAKDVPITVPGYTPRALMLQQIYWDDEGWPYFEDGRPLAEELRPTMTASSLESHGIDGINPEAGSTYLTPAGNVVKAPSQGLYLVQRPDGTVRKVYIMP